LLGYEFPGFAAATLESPAWMCFIFILFAFLSQTHG